MISVVVPVYNNNKQLNKFFKAMDGQSLDRNLFEVIVVDNGSIIKPKYKPNSFKLSTSSLINFLSIFIFSSMCSLLLEPLYIH